MKNSKDYLAEANSIVEKIKLASFSDEKENSPKEIDLKTNVTNNKYEKKIKSVKNEKIKKSLIELSKVFKKK